MAKVKNPQLPVYEVLSYENPDDPYTLGDAWRGTLTEGFLQYFDDEEYVVKKASRGERPSQKGFDLDIQLKWREAFAACVDVWRNLPNECPVLPRCDETTSKQAVWTAKQEYGVVCSYYDLFMRCCLSSYRDSEDWTFNPKDCFPCPNDWPFEVDITAASTTVPCGGSVQLLTDPVDIPEGARFVLQFGGGVLTDDGFYVAPETNLGCVDNPVIDLEVCDEIVATISLGVSCPSVDYPYAYWSYIKPGLMTRELGECWCRYDRQWWTCLGNIGSVDPTACNVSVGTCAADDPRIGLPCTDNGGCPDGVTDHRTPEEIEEGCCPGALA